MAVNESPNQPKRLLSSGFTLAVTIGGIIGLGILRTVGRTDVQNSSREDQIKSVRRLYELFPGETIVYPGHGQFTDIGSEKTENERITVDGGAWSL